MDPIFANQPWFRDFIRQHECFHAVTAIALGGKVELINMNYSAADFGARWWMGGSFDNSIIVAGAGAASDRRLLDRYALELRRMGRGYESLEDIIWAFSDGDRGVVKDIIRTLGDGNYQEEDYIKVFELGVERAQRLASDTRVQNAIVELGIELMPLNGTMSGDDVHEIVNPILFPW